MATKSTAIDNAIWVITRPGQTKRVYIYRVGSQWMFTTESQAVTQAKYKVTIHDWQEVTR